MMKLHLHFTLRGYGFLKDARWGVGCFRSLRGCNFSFLLPDYCARRSSPSFLWLKFVTAKAEQRAGWRNDLLFFDSCIFRFFS